MVTVTLAFFFFSLSSWSLVEVRNHYLLKLSLTLLVTKIREAKMEAIQSGKSIRLLFDTSENRLLYRGKRGTTEIIALPTGTTLYATNFPSNTLFFYPTGVPSCGGTITLRSKNARKYIIVTPVTGRVRIGDKPPR